MRDQTAVVAAPLPGGSEWVVEAHGCEAAALRDPSRGQALFLRIVEELGLHPAADAQWHTFPGPGGITGLLLLEESHLACHTFPEYGSLCLNLFCCRPRPRWRFEEALAELFGAVRVVVRELHRPYHA